MNMKKKLVGVACATALALGGVVPAFAADLNGSGSTSDVAIAALVAKDGTDIISVTVPSTMATTITTYKAGDGNNTPGTFKEAVTAQADVTNNAVSTKSVKVSVSKVVEQTGLVHSGSLLSLVNMKLTGDLGTDVVLSTATTDEPLFAEITPGSTGHIDLSVAGKDTTTVIPDDNYIVKPTIKVEAIPAP